MYRVRTGTGQEIIPLPLSVVGLLTYRYTSRPIPVQVPFFNSCEPQIPNTHTHETGTRLPVYAQHCTGTIKFKLFLCYWHLYQNSSLSVIFNLVCCIKIRLCQLPVGLSDTTDTVNWFYKTATGIPTRYYGKYRYCIKPLWL